MAKRRVPRVFLGFIDVCGVYRSLEYGLKAIGSASYFLNLGNDVIVENRVEPMVPRCFRAVHKRLAHLRDSGTAATPVGRLRFWLWAMVHKAVIVVLLGWIAARFDVVMVKSGASLSSSLLDLKILKRLGKTIVASYHGSDSRPRYLLGTKVVEHGLAKGGMQLRTQHETIQRQAAVADFVIDSPSSAHFQSLECCLRQAIGNAAPLYRLSAHSVSHPASPTTSSPLRVLHAPSDHNLKGTSVIEQTVRELHRRGLSFDFVKISGVPNEVLMEEVANADLVVDELYSDNFGGILALEALCLAKPVIVCGYAGEELRRFVPDWAQLPTHYCRPEELGAALERLLTDTSYRESLVLRIRKFIETVAAPEKTAERLVTLIEGQAPRSWFFDPKDIRYIGGASGTIDRVRENIRGLLSNGEGDALLVDDKPQLKQTLMTFAEQGESDLPESQDNNPSRDRFEAVRATIL